MCNYILKCTFPSDEFNKVDHAIFVCSMFLAQLITFCCCYFPKKDETTCTVCMPWQRARSMTDNIFNEFAAMAQNSKKIWIDRSSHLEWPKKHTHLFDYVSGESFTIVANVPLEKLEIEIRFFFEWLIEIVKMHRKYKVNFPRMMNVEAKRYPNMMIHI